MRPVYDVLTAFGLLSAWVEPSLRLPTACRERTATPPLPLTVVSDAIADVDGAVDAADVSFSHR